VRIVVCKNEASFDINDIDINEKPVKVYNGDNLKSTTEEIKIFFKFFEKNIIREHFWHFLRPELLCLRGSSLFYLAEADNWRYKKD
jgi:hypothetical protein